MIELTEWWSRCGQELRGEWIVLGKGPTLADYSPSSCIFRTFGLNHVVQKNRVDVAHAIDLEVIEDCEKEIESNCKVLLMPYVPNVRSRSGNLGLHEYFGVLPVLERLSRESRLVWYSLQVGDVVRSHPSTESPSISVRYFSSEAAFGILGALGVRKVHSLGIDGGASYSKSLHSLEGKTLLNNGRENFDSQFAEIDRIVKQFNMDYRPMTKPMRIFIGTDDSQILAAKTLEHSIRKHATRPVQVIHMRNLHYPKITNPNVKLGTSFSLARFKIPELAGFEGRAMYCDADMQVFGDISELWELPFESQSVLCTRQDYVPDAWKGNPAFSPGRQMSVMLLDCDRLKWDIDKIVSDLNAATYTYKQLMTDLCIVPEAGIRDDLDPGWNCLEYYDPETTKLLHYTNVPTQPWKSDRNPLRNVWLNGFREAADTGFIGLEEVAEAVVGGHVLVDLLKIAEECHTRVTGEEDDASEGQLKAARANLWDAIHRYSEAEQELNFIKSTFAYRVYAATKRRVSSFTTQKS